MRILSTVLASAFVFAPALASAHINMSVPTPRHGSEQKDGPCGVAGSIRGNNVTTFTPGQEVTIKWSETINHPGHYRIMLNPDGDTFPTPTAFDDLCDPSADSMCIADGILDKDGGQYEHTFTLHNIECTTCTIQLIQMMTDKPPYGGGPSDPDGNDIYYECADIIISASSSTTSTTVSSTGVDNGSNGSGTPTDDDGTPSSGGAGGASYSGPESEDDGCSTSGGGTGSSIFAVFGVGAALFFASRRRKSA